MAYQAGGYAAGSFYLTGDRADKLVFDTIHEFNSMQVWRNMHASMWEETANLIATNYVNTFFFQNFNWPGMKKTDKQVDATGMLALDRFAAICNSLLTPNNMTWQKLAADDDYVMKDRATRMWFETVTRILFKQRYAQLANFTSQNIQNMHSLGAFGNCAMFIDELDGTMYNNAKGLRYRACPMGEIFWIENHQGIVNGFIRWMRLTAKQAAEKWGEDKLPANLQSALQQHSQWPYNFLHRVMPRDNFDPERMDERGKPWTSCYVSLEGKCLMQPESGYRTFPLAPGRYLQGPGEVYGRGPAQMVLPALKTLNAQKRIFLKAGHRAGDPVLLTADDGVGDFNLRPGAQNAGYMTSDGKPKVGVLPHGNIDITKEMMGEERGLINDAFLVTLFQILTETPTMTATEVIERTNEKGILLAPTVGRQAGEHYGPMTHRELDILSNLHMLPPMPPRLREARGQYQIIWTSPLAKAQRAQEAAGFIRSVEFSKEVVAITQDPSYLDPYDFMEATKGIAEIQVVPESWMASPEAIVAKQKSRAQQQQLQAKIQAAPAQAAMMKAQAAMMKAGSEANPAAGGIA